MFRLSQYDMAITLSIAQVVPCTEAEGPGKRYALWFQGCPLRCPGCCNPEMLPFQGGEQRTVADVARAIHAAADQYDIEGITLLGGEPLAHVPGATVLARAVRERGLSVMVFSGYTIEEIHALPGPAAELLAWTDILVDGPYRRDQPETERRWIGSANQRIHFLTERYRADDSCWRQPNTLEIRWREGEMLINGFPVSDTIHRYVRVSDSPRATRHPENLS
ncbi:MAG: 4Fe-4S single cluster domain-containing protein [Gemmataceae bacterium]